MRGKPFLVKGQEIRNPANTSQGYRLLRDVWAGDHVMATDLEEIGDAPKPIEGEVIPKWLFEQLA